MADRFGNYGNQDVEAWRRIPSKDEPRIEAEPGLVERMIKAAMGDLGIDPMIGAVSGPAKIARQTILSKLAPALVERRGGWNVGEHEALTPERMQWLRRALPDWVKGYQNSGVTQDLDKAINSRQPESQRDLMRMQDLHNSPSPSYDLAERMRSRHLAERPIPPGRYGQQPVPGPVDLSGLIDEYK